MSSRLTVIVKSPSPHPLPTCACQPSHCTHQLSLMNRHKSGKYLDPGYGRYMALGNCGMPQRIVLHLHPLLDVGSSWCTYLCSPANVVWVAPLSCPCIDAGSSWCTYLCSPADAVQVALLSHPYVDVAVLGAHTCAHLLASPPSPIRSPIHLYAIALACCTHALQGLW
jgi:hypothetical protein